MTADAQQFGLPPAEGAAEVAGAQSQPPAGELPDGICPPLACPACGAYVQPAAKACWFCERTIFPTDWGNPTGTAAHAGSAVVGKPAPGPTPALQFSLGTLLLLTTLAAACLGVSVAVPPLGIPISIVVLGGLIRTLVIGMHHQRLGVPFPLEEKIAEFFVSCGVVIGAVGVGAITLLGTCCLGGALASGIERIALMSSQGSIVQALSALFAMSYMLLALCAPFVTTVWFLWATRPR